MISNYKRILKEFSQIEISKKDNFIAILFSFLLALLSAIGIVAICINLYVFIDYTHVITFILCSCGVLAFYIFLKTYYKLVSKGKIKDINVIYLTDTLFFAIIVYAIFALTLI